MLNLFNEVLIKVLLPSNFSVYNILFVGKCLCVCVCGRGGIKKVSGERKRNDRTMSCLFNETSKFLRTGH